MRLATACSMLNSAFTQGKAVGDQKALSSPPQFSDMGKRSEFKKFFPIINGTTTAQTYDPVIGRLASGPKQQSPRSVRTEAFLFVIALPAQRCAGPCIYILFITYTPPRSARKSTRSRA